MSWGRWLAVALVVLLAGVFAYLNAGERVTVHLGFATLYRLSLPGLTFGAFLLGMVTMFLFGLRQDLRVRRALRGVRSGPPSAARPPARSPDEEPPAPPPPADEMRRPTAPHPPLWERGSPPDASA